MKTMKKRDKDADMLVLARMLLEREKSGRGGSDINGDACVLLDMPDNDASRDYVRGLYSEIGPWIQKNHEKLR